MSVTKITWNKFRTEATHEMGYLRKNGKGILCPWKMKRKFMCCPEFDGGNVPVTEAAKIMKKDQQFIRQGMIQGFCL